SGLFLLDKSTMINFFSTLNILSLPVFGAMTTEVAVFGLLPQLIHSTSYNCPASWFFCQYLCRGYRDFRPFHYLITRRF
ncbi:hypothetical protein ACMWEM_002956, partial [Providencia stuartii]